ncbi:M28 family metallopeptidase [Nonomuraea sp. NPDC050310]|uniref:M28 family metallopeptidase n=1 Tax=unclassified Nonomuraea TaxID=2593643 RepID=UPI0033C4580D
MRIRLRVGTALAAAVLVAAPVVTTGSAQAAAKPDPVSKLVQLVKGKHAKAHLYALQAIASATGGTRVDGSRGFELSRDYVAKLLKAAGYEVSIQKFEFEDTDFKVTPSFERVSPDPKSFARGLDFYEALGTGTGAGNGKLQNVDLVIPPGPNPNSNTSGCEAADFAGFTAGNWALVQRGTCPFTQKVANAVAAGATGVVIMNEGQPGREGVIRPDLSTAPASVPVIGVEYLLGEEFAKTPGTTVKAAIDLEQVTTKYDSYNVLAETRRGDKNNVVMVGGHLDSVHEGPGINDNGSGVAAILDVALKLAHMKPDNAVRFAFWGGEEFGLLGAEHYVAQLTEAEKAKIGLYLNFDMVASPNYKYAIYDGDGDAFGTAGPEGSAEIEKAFEDFYAGRNLGSVPTAFDGRSDYGPFIATGIPAGGLFTGAEGRKTAAEYALFGGVLNGRYDPCYHQKCDTIKNINDTALDVNADAIATVTGLYAFGDALKSVHKAGAAHPGAKTAKASVADHDAPAVAG